MLKLIKRLIGITEVAPLPTECWDKFYFAGECYYRSPNFYDDRGI